MDVALWSRALSSARWSAASQGAREILRAIAILALARILVPEEFALAAIVVSIVSLVLFFTDLGTTAIVIQRPVLPRNVAGTLHLATVVVGAILASALFLAAKGFEDLWAAPGLAPLLRWGSVGILLGSLAIHPRAHLERDLLHPRVARVEVAASVAGAIVAVGGAVAGLGALAVVLQLLVAHALATIVLARLAPTPLAWDPAALADALPFAAACATSDVLAGIARAFDVLAVGHFFGIAALGAYAPIRALATFAMESLSIVSERVAFPAYARDAARASQTHLAVASALALAALPAAAGAALVAQNLVPVALGEPYGGAAWLLAPLAAVAALRLLASTLESRLAAAGGGWKLVAWNATTLFSLTPALLGAPFGLEGFVIGLLAGSLALVATALFPTWGLGFGPGAAARSVRGAAGATVAMALALLLAAPALGLLEPRLALGTAFAIGAVVYALALRAFDRARFEAASRALLPLLSPEHLRD